MTTVQATVHLLCGYNGAGKTTHARQLETCLPAARFSLDEWMLRLHPGLHYSSAEYGAAAEDCKSAIWEIALQVLGTGTDVVLDWNQWNRQRRKTWRDAARFAGFGAVLHFLDVPVEQAVRQAASRAAANTPGSHVLSAVGIRHLAGIFEPPSDDEGLAVIRIPSPITAPPPH